MQSSLGDGTRANYFQALTSIITRDKFKLNGHSLSVYPDVDPALHTKGTSTDRCALCKWELFANSLNEAEATADADSGEDEDSDEEAAEPVAMPKSVLPPKMKLKSAVLPPKMKLKQSFAEQKPNRKQPAATPVPVKKKPTAPTVKPSPDEPTAIPAAASDAQITSLVTGDSEETVENVLNAFYVWMGSEAGGKLAHSTRIGYKSDAKRIIMIQDNKFKIPVGLSVLSSTVFDAVIAVAEDRHDWQPAWKKLRKYAETMGANLDDYNGNDGDDDEGRDAICSICQNGDDSNDDIILCDAKGCTLGYHLGCLTPALSYVPDGIWECEKCTKPAAKPVPSFKPSPSPMRKVPNVPKKVQIQETGPLGFARDAEAKAAELEQTRLATTAKLQDELRDRRNSQCSRNSTASVRSTANIKGVRGSVVAFNEVQGWGWVRPEGPDQKKFIIHKQERERAKSLPGWNAACVAGSKDRELEAGVFLVEFDTRKSHSGGGQQAQNLRPISKRNEENMTGVSRVHYPRPRGAPKNNSTWNTTTGQWDKNAEDWLGSAYPDANKMTESEPGWNDGLPREAATQTTQQKDLTSKKTLENEEVVNPVYEKSTATTQCSVAEHCSQSTQSTQSNEHNVGAVEDKLPLMSVTAGRDDNQISSEIRQQFKGCLGSIKPNSNVSTTNRKPHLNSITGDVSALRDCL